MKRTWNELLAKEVTRKEFLQIVVGGLLTVFGLHNFLALLLGSESRRPQTAVADQSGQHGFGSRKFGV